MEKASDAQEPHAANHHHPPGPGLQAPALVLPLHLQAAHHRHHAVKQQKGRPVEAEREVLIARLAAA